MALQASEDKTMRVGGLQHQRSDMLVFDHLDPKDKRLEISRMVQRAYSIKTIEDEIRKCRVLCANHHLKHTIQQFGYRKWAANL